MSNETNIYQRIGETLASSGKHEIIAGNTPHEEAILLRAGFTKIGSMKNDNGNIVNLYKFDKQVKEVVRVVEVPKKDQSTWPWNDQTNPFTKPNPGIWYYNQNNPLYTYGNSTGDNVHLQYKGSTTSLMDAAYNPLSILEDYSFPSSEDTKKMTDLLSVIAQNTQPVRNV